MERVPHVDDLYFSESLLCLFPKEENSSSLYCTDLRRPGDLVEIEYPLGWERIMLLGSCRGALCIYNKDNEEVAIWNPSTRWCKRLPPDPPRLGFPACVYGFGYDDRNEEYVLLRLVQMLEDPIVSAVSIYRQRANGWRRLQGILPYSLVDPRTMGVFVGGHLHWIMRRDPVQNSAKVLVAFDIHTENSMVAHQLSFTDNRFSMYLDVLGARLCFITYCEHKGDVHAWIISGYGPEESQKFSISDCFMDGALLHPLAYSQNGHQVLLLYYGSLVWYDLHTDFEQIHINGMEGNLKAATCLKRSMILCLFDMSPFTRVYRIDFPMDVSEIGYPWEGLDNKLLGSCRGRLCISNFKDQRVIMWNPSSRWHEVLPPADTDILGPFACFHGFGYDDNFNEYVLLRLVHTVFGRIRSEVSIYRETANTWRRLEPMPYYPGGRGFYLRDRLYWIMRRERAKNSAKVLVAFDFRTETFVEVDLPNAIDNSLRMDLGVLEEHLCLTIYNELGVDLGFVDGDPRVVNVWIMTENVLNRPWDLLFSLRDPWVWGSVQPLAYSANGHRVLVHVSHGPLIWYDLQTSDIERFHIEGMPNFFTKATCLRL